MGAPKKEPGAAAERAFRTGIRAAAVAGLGAIGLLAWVGAITPLLAGFAAVVIFPVYMLVAASALSKWLGYDKEVADLRRVRRDPDADSFFE